VLSQDDMEQIREALRHLHLWRCHKCGLREIDRIVIYTFEDREPIVDIVCHNCGSTSMAVDDHSVQCRLEIPLVDGDDE